MKRHHYVYLLLFIITSCVKYTYVTGSWKSPLYETKDYDTVLVAVLTDNVVARATLENDMARELEQYGVRVMKSIDVFPPRNKETPPDKDSLIDHIGRNGADALIIMAIVDTSTETRYVPGAYTYDPLPRYGYYGNFYGYYAYRYRTVYTPGYYETDNTYYIETNMYDTDNELLLWSGQSETYNPVSITKFSKDFAKAITKEMKEDGVFDEPSK